jgi:hypothetical protein
MKLERNQIKNGCVSIALFLAVVSGSVCASDIIVENADTEIVNDMVLINADASFDFSEDALNALNSGIPLIIDLDIKIRRTRSYLWDPELLSTHRRYSIERHALSKQFILTDLITGDRRIHGSLDLAIGDLGTIRKLPLAEASELDNKAPYNFSLRLRLDIESLPAPMIPLAYISPSWHMSSGWYRWKPSP